MIPSVFSIILSLSMFQAVSQEPYSETINLKYLSATDIVSKTRATTGIDRVEIQFATNSIKVVGTKLAVENYKSEVLVHDILPTRYMVTVRIFEARVDGNGNFIERDLGKPKVSTIEGIESNIMVGTEQSRNVISTRTKLMPFSASQVLVDCAFHIRDSSSGTDEHVNGIFLVDKGLKRNIIGFTKSPKVALRNRVHNGDIVTSLGSYKGLYVELFVEETK